jgi:hypothetical protein
MDRTRRTHFTLSGPPSEASSRAPSPAPACPLPLKNGSATANNGYPDLKTRLRPLEGEISPDSEGKDVYDTTLSWWQAGLRRRLVTMVKWESIVIAKMQASSAWAVRKTRIKHLVGNNKDTMAGCLLRL